MIELVSEPIIDLYAAVRTSAAKAEAIINEVAGRYASELDEFVKNAETYLDRVRDSDSQQFDDASLQRMSMRLPILLYRVCEGLDRSAIDADVAKAAVELVRAQHYLSAPEGTIPERKAYADLSTADESAVVDLTKHVHARLKNKIEFATALQDGIKKTMTSRDTERAVFLREKR